VDNTVDWTKRQETTSSLEPPLIVEIGGKYLVVAIEVESVSLVAFCRHKFEDRQVHLSELLSSFFIQDCQQWRNQVKILKNINIMLLGLCHLQGSSVFG
jgi:hypothetical protein